MNETSLRRTPLHPVYARHGARLVPFGGWEMPVQFSGIIEEHEAVRKRVGIFDASHMGEFLVEGPGAAEALQYITLNDVAKLHPGRVQYSAILNYGGGIIDDLLVSALTPGRYMICANAANAPRDLAWFREQMARFPGVVLTDRSDETALLAVQGPAAEGLVGSLCEADLGPVEYYHLVESTVAGIPAIVSRTGYTGEDGFELFVAADRAVGLWEALMDAGEGRLTPCGLGARDTLRLEMGYLLHGQDMDDTVSPLEVGLTWITRMEKGDFIGREALQRQRMEGISRQLVGIRMTEPGVPRRGYELRVDGEPAGVLTSGTLSPSLREGIGLGFLPTEHTRSGTAVTVVIRGREVAAQVVKPPFHRGARAR